jgi:hypothetical protein
MAHHTRVRANFAAWSTGAVTQTEWDKFDTNLFKSINGDEGGVWAPSSVIEIGGSGLQVSGPFLASADATIGTTSADDLTVWSTSTFIGPTNFGITTFGGTATFNGALVANGNVTLGNAASDTLTVVAASTFQNDLTIGVTSADALQVWSTSTFIGPTAFGVATFGGASTFNGTAEFNNNVTFTDGVTFEVQTDFEGDVTIGTSSVDALLVNSSTTFFENVIFSDTVELLNNAIVAAPIFFSGTGRVPMRTGVATDASGAYSPTTANMYRVAPTTITTTRTYSISNTGAMDGDWLWFGIGPQGFSLSFEDHLGGALITFTAGTQGYALFVRMSGTWRLLGYTRH